MVYTDGLSVIEWSMEHGATRAQEICIDEVHREQSFCLVQLVIDTIAGTRFPIKVALFFDNHRGCTGIDKDFDNLQGSMPSFMKTHGTQGLNKRSSLTNGGQMKTSERLYLSVVKYKAERILE